MKKLAATALVVIGALGLAGCTTTERQMSGAAIGGAGGALLGSSVAGGLGGVVGAAGGAAAGVAAADYLQ